MLTRCSSLRLLSIVLLATVLPQALGQHVDRSRHWSQQLDDSSASGRAQAAVELARLGKEAEPALDALLDCLSDASPLVRLHSAQAIGYLMLRPGDSIDRLLPVLSDSDEHVRYAAEWAIARLALLPVHVQDARKRASALEAAVDLMEKRTHNQRHRLVIEAAIGAANELLSATAARGRYSSETIDREQHNDVRHLAELQRIARDFALSGLVEQLKMIWQLGVENQHSAESSQVEVRTKVLAHAFQSSNERAIRFAMYCWGPAADEAMHSILHELPADGSWPSWSRLLLQKYTPPGDRDVEVARLLAVALHAANEPELREAALLALGRATPLPNNAAAELLALSQSMSESPNLRAQALQVLARSGPTTDSAGELERELLQLVKNNQDMWPVRLASAEALSRLFPGSRTASDGVIGLAARQELTSMELISLLAILENFEQADTSAGDFVLHGLASKDFDVRAAAARCAGSLAAVDGRLLPALLGRFTDPAESDQVLNVAVEGLLIAGPSAVQALGKQLLTAEDFCRYRSLRALARAGDRASPAHEACLSLLQDDSASESVRSAAALAIAHMGPPARKAAPALRHWIQQTEQPLARSIALVALAEIGELHLSELGALHSGALHSGAPGNGHAASSAYARHLLGDSDGARQLVSLLDTAEQQYAADALSDVGHAAVEPLLELLYRPDISASHRIKALKVLCSIPQQSLQPLLGLIGDPSIGRACQDCLANLRDNDGQAAILRDLLQYHQREQDPAIQYRLEKLAEQLTDGTRSTTNSESHGGLQLAKRLQSEIEAEIYLRPVSSEMRESASVSLVAPGSSTEYVEESRPPRLTSLRSFPAAESVEPYMADEPPPQSVAGSQALDAARLLDVQPLFSRQRPEHLKQTAIVKVFYGTNRQISPHPAEGQMLDPASARKSAWLMLVSLLLVGAFWIAGVVRRRVLLHSMLSAAALLAIALWFSASASPSATSRAEPGSIYTTAYSDRLSLGICQVSIPGNHQMGKLETPSVIRLEFGEDEQKHIILRSAQPLESDAFFENIDQELRSKGDGLLVFVHGYNVSFEDAARRTAQMAYDLNFPGAPVFYSWPSQSNWYQYQMDRKNIELSVGHIRRFLEQLVARSGAKSIHLIAHSMGNVGLTEALAELEAGQGPLFNQVVLAAPDIDADIFRNRIAPRIVGKAQRCTLYTSKTDLALVASRYFNAGQRAGETIENQTYEGIDVIDASSVDTSLLGHTYYGGFSLLNDLSELLLDRPLQERTYIKTAMVKGRPYSFVAIPQVAEATRGNGSLPR
jgi:esterase/lipase superfamily enzyme